MIRKLFAIIYIMGCIYSSATGANKYAVADHYLRNGDYEMAAKAYYNILEEKGSAAFSKDVRAMTGAFIAYFMLQEYKKSFALCKRVLKLQPYHSAAIFYAGQTLEALGNEKLAKNIYKYYTVMPSSAPYRRFIKAKYTIITQKDIEKKVKNAIQLEESISSQKIPENSVAILYFVNDSYDQTMDSFGKGFAQLIIYDLSFAKNIKLSNREQLQILLEKLQVDQSQLNDQNLIPRLARLLKVKYIVSGSFNVDNNSKISINIGITNLARPKLIEQTEFTGSLKEVFRLEKNILSKIIAVMNLAISSSEKRKIMKFSTKKLDAFLAYSKGLDAYDFGNYDAAYSHFSLATKMDHNFFLANDMQQTVDAMIMIDQGNLALNHFQIIKKSLAIGERSYTSITRARLENISTNLDLGYLPGNDSRNGTGGLDLSNLQIEKNKLPEPPPPPSHE